MSDGLRRRKANKDDEDGSTSTRAFEKLKQFDVYAKVQDDYLEKSRAGGIVTVITGVIIALLFWSEVVEFCTSETVHTISVDTRINQKLQISLDLIFPHLRCHDVSVDTVDSAGDNQVDVHGGLHKVPLDSVGHETAEDPPLPAGTCLSCFAATDNDQYKCCNTCRELKQAYSDQDLPYEGVLDTAEQCKGAVGCRVKGKVVVNKVSGNVHVALGQSRIEDGKLVHEFNMNDVTDLGFNTSHTIEAVSFGDRVEGVVSPLDGTTKVVRHGTFMFHYYIKLVPTVFVDTWGVETYTNQYSATDGARNVQIRKGELSGLPGVFIVYDFSPFLMRKTVKAKPWSYIFTSICAIIGGVFSIASLVETLMNSVILKLMAPCRPATQKF